MNRIKLLLKRSWRESRGFNKIVNMPLAILFSHLLESGKGNILLYLDSSNIFSTRLSVASYYFAHAHYLHGNYDMATNHLVRLLRYIPYHADATYLLCSIDEIEGRKESAWKKLILLVRNSSRLKTWLVMANLVNESYEFDMLYREWIYAISCNKLPRYHLHVNSYLATAALRAELYGHAKKIWQNFLVDNSKNTLKNKKTPPCYTFSRSRAERALLDIKALLEKHKVEFFLVSGTLLGCIREGRILSHDKDVDIGVWDNTNVNFLLSIFRKSGMFYILALRSAHVVRVKHVNGTAIDVFVHYRCTNNYWHAGVKIKWNNTPFRLVEYPFLGAKFNIPSDYDLYLKENYGDWETPKQHFNSSTDTTNAEILNKDEFEVHLLKEMVYSNLRHG